MAYKISVYGFIRASERCAELRDVLDDRKMAKQLYFFASAFFFLSWFHLIQDFPFVNHWDSTIFLAPTNL